MTKLSSSSPLCSLSLLAQDWGLSHVPGLLTQLPVPAPALLISAQENIKTFTPHNNHLPSSQLREEQNIFSNWRLSRHPLDVTIGQCQFPSDLSQRKDKKSVDLVSRLGGKSGISSRSQAEESWRWLHTKFASFREAPLLVGGEGKLWTKSIENSTVSLKRPDVFSPPPLVLIPTQLLLLWHWLGANLFWANPHFLYHHGHVKSHNNPSSAWCL